MTTAVVIIVFRQGFIEAKNRPATWWEKKDGQKVKGSHSVDDLLQQGIGKCPETALQLVIREYFSRSPRKEGFSLQHYVRGRSIGVVVRIRLPLQHWDPACHSAYQARPWA